MRPFTRVVRDRLAIGDVVAFLPRHRKVAEALLEDLRTALDAAADAWPGMEDSTARLVAVALDAGGLPFGAEARRALDDADELPSLRGGAADARVGDKMGYGERLALGMRMPMSKRRNACAISVMRNKNRSRSTS